MSKYKFKDESSKPNHARNIIQESVRLLAISTNIKKVGRVTHFVESCFEIMGKAGQINLAEVVCCVQEYWQI
jgi:hypothetical protein